MSLWSCSTRDCGIICVTRQIHRQTLGLSRLRIFARTVGPAAAGLALAAALTTTVQPVYVLGIAVDFIVFGLTLIAVALFHHKKRVDLPAIHVTMGNA